MNYLIVPGLNNSGPAHWQSFWAKSLSKATRVEQRCWDHPEKTEWVETLDRTVRGLVGDTLIVAHSLGVSTVVNWLLQSKACGTLPAYVKGAFFVSPSDVDNVEVIRSFAPMPLLKLPVPSCVLASINDPFVSMERARFFAAAWGADLFDVGNLGHINAESNLGEWELGRRILSAFEKSLK